MELSSLSPLMAFGYGLHGSGVPELCVRLLQAEELLAIWTLPQFEARLQTMRRLNQQRETPHKGCWEAPSTSVNGSSLVEDAERLFVKLLSSKRGLGKAMSGQGWTTCWRSSRKHALRELAAAQEGPRGLQRSCF